MSNPLLIDLYQLTMAQGYYRVGLKDAQASFVYSFRENPFRGGFALFAGVEGLRDYLLNWGFSDEDCQWLATLKAADGSRLFADDFLQMLGALRMDFDVAAAAEGSIVFAGEPLARVTGSLISCQLIETALMNRLNFETLIATKAARCYSAADGDPVLEFGLRRAQGPDGGATASRAAYVGGCSATSNIEAARRFDIPVAGTHAHSWVMAFDHEEDAFEAWTHSSPNNSVLLVDTYDSLNGIKQAVRAGAQLKAAGGDFSGIRLDSGDLAWLSKRAREMLDAAGLQDAQIFVSNDLDEYTIASLKEQGALIDSWGVGTRLATGGSQSALGGVYKMTALKKPGATTWEPKLKVSDQASKTSTPGLQGVRRYFDANGSPVGDMIYDLENPPCAKTDATIVDPQDLTRQKSFSPDMHWEELLQPLFEGGRAMTSTGDIHQIRESSLANLRALDESHKRFMQPHRYPVGLERSLFEKQLQLVKKHKGITID
ncbi:MAG: nicotinate phosphoribosyltransferase [Coriobacteriia bacterium]|nr:nicotinate phosphoribosyltransferase [Coriobacteriia bacterium]